MLRLEILSQVIDKGDYLQNVISLLNNEWKMSDTVRRDMLLNNVRKQKEDLVPVNLLLVDENENVISHAQLIKSQQDVYVVESVVTAKEKQGKGYGKKLMEKVCDYLLEEVKKRNSSTEEVTLYLKTNVWQFYEKCGFTQCDAPTATGRVCSNLNDKQINLLANMLAKKVEKIEPSQHAQSSDDVWMKKTMK
ncbi:hypothetical protein ABK040_010330 [Willaertia magna]